MSVRRHASRLVAVLAAVALVPVMGVSSASAAPPPISGLTTYAQVGSVTFTWDNPTIPGGEPQAKKTLVQAKIGLTAPTSPTDGVLHSDESLNCGGTTLPAEQSLHVCPQSDITWITGLDPGTDFTFAFFVVDTSDVVSAAVTTTLRATDLSLRSSRSSLTYGSWTTFVAKLVRTTGGAPVAGAKVDFYVRAHGTRAWFFWEERTTNSAGVASSRFRPGLKLEVQAFYYGQGAQLGTSAGAVTVGVRSQVSASVNFSARKKGKKFTVRGVVSSKDPGRTVWIERLRDGKWKRVDTARGTLSTKSGTTTNRVSWTVKPKKKGKYTYRVTSPGSSKYLTASSRSVKFRVT